MDNNKIYVKTPDKAFDQGIVIEELKQRYKNNETNRNIINDIKDGMCYMLSIEWLMQLLDNNNLSPKDVFPNMGNYEIEGEIYNYSSKDLAYFMQIADNFYKYSADFDLSNYGYSEHPGAEVISYLSDKHYVEACTLNKYTVSNTKHFSIEHSIFVPEKFIESLSDKEGLLISIYIRAKDNRESFAHELAIWQNNNTYYFFDPNYGIYEFNDLINIFDEIEFVYENLYQKITNKELSEISCITFEISTVVENKH